MSSWILLSAIILQIYAALEACRVTTNEWTRLLMSIQIQLFAVRYVLFMSTKLRMRKC